MRGKIYILALVFVFTALTSYSQIDSLNGIVRQFDKYRKDNFQEKVFANTDRTFYLTGETIWLNLFVVDGYFHKPSNLSKVAYAEVLDQDNRPVVQAKLLVEEGNGKAAIFLPATIASGNYQLRAYTRWMQNYGPAVFFTKQITIANPFTKLGLKPPSTETSKTYDVQFFPEGGQLVNGLRSKVGVRVVDNHGIGIELKGVIVNESNDSVTHFTSEKFGLGQFFFTPASGHTYKAVVWNGPKRVEYRFPVASASGYVISVYDTTESRLKIKVNAKFTGEPPSIPYVYMLTHTRESIIASATKVLSRDATYFLVDKGKLGDGVSHIALFDDNMRPVADRCYFKKPESNLTIAATPNQAQYGVREKVELALTTQLGDGKPAPANLSISVYKIDSLESRDSGNIVNYLLLTSDVKGHVESPEFYFGQQATAAAAENLMLTQGWSRFKWEDVTHDSSAHAYAPEFRGHIISGRVVRGLTSTPVARRSTSMSTPGRNIQYYLSRSAEDGSIQYETQRFFGNRRVIFRTTAPVDSNFRIELKNPFSTSFAPFKLPTFDISENFKSAITQRSLDMQIQSIFFEEFNKPIEPPIDSMAFYGKPDEKYFLDDYTRFPTMEEVMREYVPGVMVRKRKDQFHFLNVNSGSNSLFRENPLVLIDGVQVLDINKVISFDPRKVQRLDVMTHLYYYGHLSYEGIVSYTTYHGDLAEFELEPGSLSIMYEGLQLEREFFSPQYETVQQRTSRVPDARDLLYWAPATKTDGTGKVQLSFFTSDVGGKYIGIVQGLSTDGKPGVGSFTFRITDKDNY